MKISLLAGMLSLSLMSSAMTMDGLDHIDLSSVGMKKDEFNALVEDLKGALEEPDYRYVQFRASRVLQDHQNLTPSQKEELELLKAQAESGLDPHSGGMQHNHVDHQHQNFVQSMEGLRQLFDQGKHQAVIDEANDLLTNGNLTESQKEEIILLMSEATHALESSQKKMHHHMHGDQGEWEAYNPEDLRDRDSVHKMKHHQEIREQFAPGAHNPNQEGYFNPNEGRVQEDNMDPELREKLNKRLKKGGE